MVEKEKRHNAYILIYERQSWSEEAAKKLTGASDRIPSKEKERKRRAGSKRTIKLKDARKGKEEADENSEEVKEDEKECRIITRKRSGSLNMSTSIEEARRTTLIGNKQLRRSRFVILGGNF